MVYDKLSASANRYQQLYTALASKYKRAIEELEIERTKVSLLESLLRANNIDPSLACRDIPSTSTCSTILETFIEVQSRNMNRCPNGRRYKNLKTFFTLLSFMGPRYFNIMHTTLLTPSYRMSLHYRQRLIEELGVTYDIFNGDDEHLRLIFETCFCGEVSSPLVLMVDAAYVTPYVKVKRSGQLEGFVSQSELPQQLAEHLCDDPSTFDTFVKVNADSIIRSEFVYMVAPVDGSSAPFPICSVASDSGKATSTSLDAIEALIGWIQNEGYLLCAISTDGDNSYTQYSRMFTDSICASIDDLIDLDVCEIVEQHSFMRHMSDPFHLAKRDRYRKASRDKFFISPNDLVSESSRTTLIRLGVSEYVLSDEKARKMDDFLPLQLFSLDTIEKICEADDIPLLFSMLPTTLLLESIHAQSLSRAERIHYLSLGGTFVLIWLIVHRIAINENREEQSYIMSQMKQMRCFTQEWCIEYVSTCFCIVNLLYTQEKVDLGSCGTHYLEHFFGNVRNDSCGDDTHKRFMTSMRNTFLERYLINVMGIELVPPSGRSDSGAFVCDDMVLTRTPLKSYVSAAMKLMNNFVQFPQVPLFVNKCPEHEKSTCEDVLALFANLKTKQTPQLSTKSRGITVTGGLSNCRHWKANEQISK